MTHSSREPFKQQTTKKHKREKTSKMWSTGAKEYSAEKGEIGSAPQKPSGKFL